MKMNKKEILKFIKKNYGYGVYETNSITSARKGKIRKCKFDKSNIIINSIVLFIGGKPVFVNNYIKGSEFIVINNKIFLDIIQNDKHIYLYELKIKHKKYFKLYKK